MTCRTPEDMIGCFSFILLGQSWGLTCREKVNGYNFKIWLLHLNYCIDKPFEIKEMQRFQYAWKKTSVNSHFKITINMVRYQIKDGLSWESFSLAISLKRSAKSLPLTFQPTTNNQIEGFCTLLKKHPRLSYL